MTTASALHSADAPTQEKPRNGSAPRPAANQHTFTASEWSVEESAKLYNIKGWGQDYFSINPEGNVAVHPTGDPGKAIDLKKLVDDLRSRDIAAPVLIRFTDILKHRVDRIHDAFDKAIKDHDFHGHYRCVYPIKVNQQRHVVEEIHYFGKAHNFGLEAGSKPELLAVMAIVDDDQTPIVCNGFKDDEFIEAIILATKIGRTVIPVVEKFSELEAIVKFAKIHNVRPRIGVRVKLSAKGAG
ncbi:MAG: biosynthetic arginine decarboxylase, partial [Tepidisphaeraceae bacterium]